MKRLLVAILVLVVAQGLFASGGQEGTPAPSQGPIEVDFIAPAWDVNPEMNEWWIWQAYEEMNGIHVNWEEIPRPNLEERKNLMFAANDLPDAFWQVPFTTAEIARYGSQGMLVNLTDLLDEHAPALTAVMEQHPSVGPVLTMPDGNIYSFPYIMEDGNDASLRYYINKHWMERVGATERPETLDDFTELMIAFRDEDANGNGDPSDEIPIYMAPDTFAWTFERQLFGAFGVGGHGLPASAAYIYLDDSGKIDFVYTSEGGKELWQYEAMLWSEGLIHPETFTGYEYAKWVADGAADLVGTYSWVGPNYLGESVQDNFVGVTQMEGPHGDRVLTWIDPPARGNWSFLITTENEYVEETIGWADYFYSPEGSRFGFIGLEGETYNMVDGVPVYIDEILNYEGGVQLGSFQYGLLVYGGYYPYIEPPAELIEAVKGMSKEEVINCDPDEYLEYAPDEIWPTFAPAGSEAEEIQTIMTDVETYITESRVKFLTGEWNFTTDWDAYVAQLERMGIERYIEIRQAQYDRYKAAM